MRIAFDARSYFMRTGIARYTRGLARALAVSPGSHEWLILISDHHEPEELGVGVPAVEVRQSRAPWLGGAAERDVLAREAATWSADVFHAVFPPHALATVPTITTVFDFSPLSHPDLHQEVVRSAFLDAWTSARADARGFIAVSGATGDRIRERIDDTRPISTIPCGLSAPFDTGPSSADVANPREGILLRLARFGVGRRVEHRAVEEASGDGDGIRPHTRQHRMRDDQRRRLSRFETPPGIRSPAELRPDEHAEPANVHKRCPVAPCKQRRGTGRERLDYHHVGVGRRVGARGGCQARPIFPTRSRSTGRARRRSTRRAIRAGHRASAGWCGVRGPGPTDCGPGSPIAWPSAAQSPSPTQRGCPMRRFRK